MISNIIINDMNAFQSCILSSHWRAQLGNLLQSTLVLGSIYPWMSLSTERNFIKLIKKPKPCIIFMIKHDGHLRTWGKWRIHARATGKCFLYFLSVLKCLECFSTVYIIARTLHALWLVKNLLMFYQSGKHRKSVFHCFAHVKSLS